ATAPATLRTDTTSPAEARRVDRVRAPRPDWFDCSPLFGERTECATVKLPLDYDQPRGAQTEVAVLRIKAANQKRKLGTLFLNPGGPGGSGVEIAAAAPFFLSPSLLARFDVVGMDPRGTNYSANVRCWPNVGAQAAALSGLNVAFPFLAAEKRAYIASAQKFGRACSTTGKPLTAHMSTANVARDMDVLRRTFGDTKLSYLGFSYGSYLGNVYANLFPDRVRAVAIDGVLDPIAWAGTLGNADVPQTARLRSGEGAAKALDEILRRCTQAGPDYCMLAGTGNPRGTYARIVAALKKQPLAITDEETGEVFFEITYAILVSFLLSDLYSPDGYSAVDFDLSFIWALLQDRADPGSVKSAERARATRALVGKFEDARAAEKAAKTRAAQGRAAVGGFAFPYFNGPEAFQSVLCTDGRNPADANRWPTYADRANATAPGFGPLWTWASAPCASNTWTVRDTDAYAGPFTRRTSAPVLVVGNYWDPATNYQGAVSAASLLPNSRLVSSDSWGHTAYGTSACVTGSVDRYLLTGAVPKPGTKCTGDVAPFTEPLEPPEGPESPESRRAAPPSRPLPPVVPP
ncbi:MAG: alpha/beta hydrolase, partial [Candidatus Nanopelagicales bacterium]